MVQIRAQITPRSEAEFVQAIREVSETVRGDFHDVLIQRAGLAARDFVTYTPPMAKSGGGGDKPIAHKLGKFAVYWDIKRIFDAGDSKEGRSFMFFRSLCGSLYANDLGMFSKLTKSHYARKNQGGIFNKIINDGDKTRAMGKMKNLLSKFVPQYKSDDPNVIASDIETIHKRLLQTANGRRIRKAQNIGLSKLNKYIVDSNEKLKAYILKEQNQVGRLKAGWIGCIQNLPARKKARGNIGKKAPVWVLRHSTSSGYVRSNLSNPQAMSIVIGNAIGDNNNTATDAGTKGFVYGLQVNKMQADMKQYLLRTARKFNKE